MSQSSYNDHMKRKSSTVGSRELKTRLGAYLKRVRSGETIVVTDRGEPVAELRPIAVTEDATEQALQRMAAEGLITRGKGRGSLTPFRPIKLPPGVSLSELVIRERDEGY